MTSLKNTGWNISQSYFKLSVTIQVQIEQKDKIHWRWTKDPQTMAHQQNLAQHLFLYIKFYWHIAPPIGLKIIYANFLAKMAERAVVTKTIRPEKLKIFTTWPFIEKVCLLLV